jgi:hypothetical protein
VRAPGATLSGESCSDRTRRIARCARPIARHPRLGPASRSRVGIVDVVADVVTERGVAVVDHVIQDRVEGRVAAVAHRPDVEQLVVVLLRARDFLEVLDLVGRMLEVASQTAPDLAGQPPARPNRLNRFSRSSRQQKPSEHASTIANRTSSRPGRSTFHGGKARRSAAGSSRHRDRSHDPAICQIAGLDDGNARR